MSAAAGSASGGDRSPFRPPPLYAIVDGEVAAGHGWTVPAVAAALLDGGATLLQLRCAGRSTATILAWADALVARARPYGARVIVNDRPDVARLSGADGVHVGQDDLPAGAVRRIVGPAIVGLSTHSPSQLAAAADEPVDYVAVGPIHATSTKQTGYGPVGLDLIRAGVAAGRGRPVVAIGGMTIPRAVAALGAGAASVAVIGDLFRGGDPAARVRAYLDALEK